MNISDGIGVKQLILINEIAAGKWPLRAPTKNKRDDANMAPFNEPNVEQATKSGIIHANMPNIFVANVTWKIGQIDMRYAFEVKKKYHEGMKSVIMTKLTATASDEIISSDDRTAK